VILRDAQLRALERQKVRDFVSIMEKHLRSSFPEQTRNSDPAGLRDGIAVGIGIAKTYGLVRECDVEGYLNVMCASSRDIGGDPPEWMRHILVGTGFSPKSKVQLLYSGYQDRGLGQPRR
jgi:hypothetical protein